MALRLARDTSENDRHATWVRVVERIHDEHVNQAWRHYLFRLVRGVFTTNPELSADGGFIFNWAAENYLDASLMLVRRELDVQAGTENLRNLLEDVGEHSAVLTRSRYRAQWGADGEFVDRVFDSFTPVKVHGAPERDHVDPVVVKADLDQVVADGERLRVYAERTRAHRTPDRGIDTSITFRDLHQVIADVRSVVGKYYALLTLKSMVQWEPTPQYDTLSAFMKPWVVDPQAVSGATEQGATE